ncbi:MAG TPA: hypothetical protein VK528_13260 [Flavobacterium sp.]|nr:hypothetical protein [Flavobacterium sp.]
MKNLTTTIILSALFLCGNAAFAQQKKTTKSQPSKTTSASSFYKTSYATRNSGSFDGDTHLITLSYGVPNTIDYTGFFYGNSESSVGPASIRYEFPIRDEAGVGLGVSGATKKYSYFGGSETKVSGIAISPLGFYHFNKLIPIAKLDVYAGIGASVNLLNYTYEDTDEKDSDVEIDPAGLVGARYYFTHSFSAMAEVGEGSFSIFRVGLSFRL